MCLDKFLTKFLTRFQNPKKKYFQYASWKRRAQHDLPYLPTPHEIIPIIFEFLERHDLINSGMRLIDLGAGDGRIILYAAEHYHLKTVGVEISEEFIQSAQQKIVQRSIEAECTIVEGDLYNMDISSYDIVWIFLFPTSHAHFKHVMHGLKPGATIVSIRWPLSPQLECWEKYYRLTPLKGFETFVYVNCSNDGV